MKSGSKNLFRIAVFVSLYSFCTSVAPADDTLPHYTKNFAHFVLNPTTDAPFVLIIDDNTEDPIPFSDGRAKKLLPYGTHTWSAICPDYEPQNGTVQVDAANRSPTEVSVVDLCGILSVNCPTPGAILTIEGESMGSASSWRSRMHAGEYLVEIEAPDHHKFEKTVSITSREETNIAGVLTPITGVLVIDVTPETATVEIDGREAGTGSCVLKDIIVGAHTVTLSADGYYSTEHHINLREDDVTEMTASLDEIKARTFTVPGTSVSFRMIPVEGGTFQMGDSLFEDSNHIHTVEVSSFMIGETEVTGDLWDALGKFYGSLFGFGSGSGAVYNVSWNDCQIFIDRLNENLADQLDGAKFRLPTEAEWEYAARGGNRSKGYIYAGSNDLRKVAHCNDLDASRPHCVKTLAPNELGLYDMTGNVEEWCLDEYHPDFYSMPGATRKNPFNTIIWPYHPSRVIRGCSYGVYSNLNYCRISARSYGRDDMGENNRGFRLALQLKSER